MKSWEGDGGGGEVETTKRCTKLEARAVQQLRAPLRTGLELLG